jgi:hypothetical protein
MASVGASVMTSVGASVMGGSVMGASVSAGPQAATSRLMSSRATMNLNLYISFPPNRSLFFYDIFQVQTYLFCFVHLLD